MQFSDLSVPMPTTSIPKGGGGATTLIPGRVSPDAGLPALLYTGQPIVGQHVFIPAPSEPPTKGARPRRKGRR